MQMTRDLGKRVTGWRTLVSQVAAGLTVMHQAVV